MNDLFGEDEFQQIYDENSHDFGGVHLKIREFSFHRFNANQVWPGNQIFAEFLKGQVEFLKGKKVLELGSGSGILSIFLRILEVDVTASDCPDEEVRENIMFNAKENGVELEFFPRKE
jgi:predicted nicotinamide N-methyase